MCCTLVFCVDSLRCLTCLSPILNQIHSETCRSGSPSQRDSTHACAGQLSADDANISKTRGAAVSSATPESACRDSTMWDRPQGTQEIHMATGLDKSPGGVWAVYVLVSWPGAAGTGLTDTHTHTHVMLCTHATCCCGSYVFAPYCVLCLPAGERSLWFSAPAVFIILLKELVVSFIL